MTILETERERVTARPRLTHKANGKARSRQFFAKHITSCWKKRVRYLVWTGHWLIEAKEELPHGEFTRMVNFELPFDPRTGQKLMCIARNGFLSKPTHESLLPAHLETLYLLSQLTEAVLAEMLADGVIKHDMERKDAEKLLRFKDCPADYRMEKFRSAFATLVQFAHQRDDRSPARQLLAQAVYEMWRTEGAAVEVIGDLPVNGLKLKKD
jgi:hypothetical protein